jgi:AcrR family transcriptional regulator
MVTHIVASSKRQRAVDPRVERSRAALRRALLELLEKHSYDEITIRDICSRARAGYATYFRHYPDKAALLNDLAAAGIAELLGHAMPVLYSADARAACVALCSYVDDRRHLWSALLTGGAGGILREEFVRQARRAAAERKRLVRPRSRLPADLAIVFGVSGLIEVLAWWLEHRKERTIEEIAEILECLVVGPILRT